MVESHTRSTEPPLSIKFTVAAKLTKVRGLQQLWISQLAFLAHHVLASSGVVPASSH